MIILLYFICFTVLVGFLFFIILISISSEAQTLLGVKITSEMMLTVMKFLVFLGGKIILISKY